MNNNLTSVLSKITDSYLELVEKSSEVNNSASNKSHFLSRHFHQLVNDLLDQTSIYMNEDEACDSTECTEVVQSELERFVNAIAES